MGEVNFGFSFISATASNFDFGSGKDWDSNREIPTSEISQIWNECVGRRDVETPLNSEPQILSNCSDSVPFTPWNGDERPQHSVKQLTETEHSTFYTTFKLANTRAGESHPEDDLVENKVEQDSQSKRKIWTEQEHKKLEQVMKKYGPDRGKIGRTKKQWKKIACEMRRPPEACKKRWEILKGQNPRLEKKLKSRAWTPQEEKVLKTSLAYFHSHEEKKLTQVEWEKIAISLQRSVSACKNRTQLFRRIEKNS